MLTATIRDLRLATSRVLSRSRNGPVVVTKRGRPVAAILALGREELEDFLLENHPRYRARLEEAERDLLHGRMVSLDKFLAGKRI